jgi:hypothetical protein
LVRPQRELNGKATGRHRGQPAAKYSLGCPLDAKVWRKRQRLPDAAGVCNAAIHSLRLCVESTFAWEDKFKRLLLRFEFKQQRHYGMKLMAYTLINLRHFCGA